MKNPWLKKNPFLSMWLSGANTVLGTARGHASKSVQQQATASMRNASQAMMNAWLSPLAAPSSRRKKRR